MSRFTDAQLEQIRKLFAEADKDKSGHLTGAEIGVVLGGDDKPVTPDVLAGALKELDTSGDGKVSLQEFVKYLEKLRFE
jgi:calcium-binding protein CML